MKWQPIETAPDTFADVLLYCGETNEQFVGFRYQLGKPKYQFAVCEGMKFICSPSHWMPLPEPPEVDNNGQH